MGGLGTKGVGGTGGTAGRKEAPVARWGRHRRHIRPRPKQTRDKINREIGSQEGRTGFGSRCLWRSIAGGEAWLREPAPPEVESERLSPHQDLLAFLTQNSVPFHPFGSTVLSRAIGIQNMYEETNVFCA